MKKHKRSTFSGKLGFVLSAAGASVGLGKDVYKRQSQAEPHPVSVI